MEGSFHYKKLKIYSKFFLLYFISFMFNRVFFIYISISLPVYGKVFVECNSLVQINLIFFYLAAWAGHAVAYTIVPIFKHIIDCVQLYFSNGFTNVAL